MNQTSQEIFWKSEFGKEYTDRNKWTNDVEWDQTYIDTWGLTKLEINDKVLHDLPRDIRILEVGCNYGAQLRGLQRMGFTNLYGVELQSYAVEQSKKAYSGMNIITGSGFDLPFKDGFFDLVCTNGVLIHISPSDHYAFMKEIVRCTNKYIMGWEYYSEEITELNYRNNEGFMWKGNYPKIYQDNFSCLEDKHKQIIKYLSNDNQDVVFLLEKS